MNLFHVKMNNGTDVLAVVNDGDLQEDTITLHVPVEFRIHMDHGPWMQSYLFLSDEDSVRIKAKSVMWVHPASPKAVEYYNKFMETLSAKYNEEAEAQELHESSDEPELTMDDVRLALDQKMKNKMH